MPESAFSQDEARRRQLEAEQQARKDEQAQAMAKAVSGLHGRERTDAARDLRAEMRAAVAGGQAPRNEAAPKEQRPVQVTINAPHQVQVRENQIALTINGAGKGAAGDQGATQQVIVFANGVLAMMPAKGGLPVAI